MNNYFLSELTVIILTYKTNRGVLKTCLDSIDKRVKIKIIENSDKFENENEFLKKYSNLSIDCTLENFGFGRGYNFGFKKINTKFAFVLSPDTICDTNFFDNLEIHLNSKIDFSIMGVSYYEEDVKKTGHLPYGYFKKNQASKKFNETLLDVDWVIGCAMIINLSKFNDKKVFDENIFIYFEDFDICMSLLKKGVKIFSSKILFIKHIGNSSSVAIDPELKNAADKFRSWHFRWSQFYFHKKHYGNFYAYRKSFSKFFRYLILMLVSKIFLDKQKFDELNYSFQGLFCSILGKKSSYRIKMKKN